MADPFTLAVGAFAFSAVSSFASAAMTASANKSAASATAETARLQNIELTRQQEEVNRIAQEEKGDRAREADRELATLRVMAGETGAVQTGTFIRQVQELGFFEGLDLSRIESNRKAKIEGLQSEKVAATHGALATISRLKNDTRAARVGAVLGTVGSGLQIGTAYVRDREFTEFLKSRTT